jgi:hypothetical protein
VSQKTSNCKYCGCSIYWVETKSGWRPYNAVTKEPHFDECRPPKHKSKSKQKKGRPLIGKPVLVIGINYVPSNCDCDIPPWELCPHSFPDLLKEANEFAMNNQDAVLAALDRLSIGAHK